MKKLIPFILFPSLILVLSLLDPLVSAAQEA